MRLVLVAAALALAGCSKSPDGALPGELPAQRYVVFDYQGRRTALTEFKTPSGASCVMARGGDGTALWCR